MSYIELSYVYFEFYSFTCYIDDICCKANSLLRTIRYHLMLIITSVITTGIFNSSTCYIDGICRKANSLLRTIKYCLILIITSVITIGNITLTEPSLNIGVFLPLVMV